MKLTRKQQLFKYLQEYFVDKIYKLSYSNMKLVNNKEIIKNEIANLLLKYDVDKDLKLNMSSSEIAAVNKKISKIINDSIAGEYKEQNKMLKGVLNNAIDETYFANSYILSVGGVNTSMRKVSEVLREKTINHTIKGKNFSDRLYDDKNGIAAKLKISLNDLVKGKTDVNSIKDDIEKTFKIDENITKRLIHNEIARVQNEINQQWQEDHKEYIKKVMWSATLEGNTCSECGELDGQTWDTDEEHPVPIDSTHPLCRCCLIALPSSDWRPPTRIDNNTKDTINWTTYKEWKENMEEDE